MSFSLKTAQKARQFYHGGRVVLSLYLDRPLGDAAATEHLRCLVACLEHYAEEALLPRATEALEKAATTGAIHSFFPYHYRVKCEFSPLGACCCLTLSTLLTAGHEPLAARELKTYWDADGTLQLPAHRALRSRRKGPHSPRTAKGQPKFSKKI